MTDDQLNGLLSSSPSEWLRFAQAIYENTWGFAFGYAYSILKNADRARDATQDAFTAVLKNSDRKSFKSLKAFKTYLRRAVYWSCMNILRGLAGIQQLGDDYESGPRDHVVVGTFSTDDLNILTHCVDGVRPDKCRLAFELRHGVERQNGSITAIAPFQRSLDDVSAALGVGVPQASQLISSATDQIVACVYVQTA